MDIYLKKGKKILWRSEKKRLALKKKDKLIRKQTLFETTIYILF